MHHTMCRKTASSDTHTHTHTHTHSPSSAKFHIGLFINNTIMHWVHSWVCSWDHLNYAETCTVCAPSHTHTKCIQHTCHSHHMHAPIGTNRLSRPFSPINFVGNMSELLTAVCSQKKAQTRGKGTLKCAWINLWWRKPRDQELRTGTSQSALLCIQIGTCGAECRLTWVWLLREDAGICQCVIYARFVSEWYMLHAQRPLSFSLYLHPVGRVKINIKSKPGYIYFYTFLVLLGMIQVHVIQIKKCLSS